MISKLTKRIRRELAAGRAERAGVAALYGVDINSPAARIGNGLMTLSLVLRIVEPLLVLLLMFVISAVPAAAQSPGNIFGSDAQTPGRGLVEAIKYFRNVIFIAGIAFFMWGAINMGFEKPWGGKAIAGAACWAFAGISALVYTFSQGDSVQLDTSGLGR